jgi:hypothetical protein
MTISLPERLVKDGYREFAHLRSLLEKAEKRLAHQQSLATASTDERQDPAQILAELLLIEKFGEKVVAPSTVRERNASDICFCCSITFRASSPIVTNPDEVSGVDGGMSNMGMPSFVDRRRKRSGEFPIQKGSKTTHGRLFLYC